MFEICKKEIQSGKAAGWKAVWRYKKCAKAPAKAESLAHYPLLHYSFTRGYFPVFSSTHLRALTNASIHGVTWSL